MPNDLQPCCADEEHQNHAERFTANAVGKRVEKRIGGPSDDEGEADPEQSRRTNNQMEYRQTQREML